MTPPAESTRVVRERHFVAPDISGTLVAFLRRERFTGAVTLNFVDGGVGSADAVDSQKVTFDEIPLDSTVMMPAQSRT
jgi:hypothetical protein